MTSVLSVRRLGAAVLLAALAVAGAPALGSTPATAASGGVLDPGLPLAGSALQPVVVSADAVRSATAAVHAEGGLLGRALPLVDGVAARVPADRLAALAARPGVRAVTYDRTGHVTGNTYDDSTSASPYVWATGATSLWPTTRGAGVGVAVIDTGVAPVNDLAGRVVSGPDLSGEGRPDVDSYGHGTVMGGIVGGSGVDAGASPRTGVAPGATLVSVKVAGANGAADVSTVLAAMHWVAAFRDTYGIRVLNLSWGVPSTQDPAVDPLDHAVERLWSLGITVVVAAGNTGPDAGSVLKPGDDPLVVTVGAYDDKGDVVPSNDASLAWSSRGPTAQGVQKPDLLAPGRTLIAPRAPGSTVESGNPKALVSPAYIRGSGSSEATAVVSGAAALLLAARPSLTPDQVKAALLRTAVPLPRVDVPTQGAGRLNVAEAAKAAVGDVATRTPLAKGTGSLDASRGSSTRVQVTCGGAARVLDDETTSWCAPWNGGAWTGNAWTGNSWLGNAWTGNAWTGNAWTGNAWTGATWSSAAWAGNAWTGNAWTGNAWTGNAWTSTTWAGNAWTGNAWTSGSYDADVTEFQSAFWGSRPSWWRHLPGETSDARPQACRRDREC